ncbi:MAG: 1-(5-phosphoribosyl)-5-[(5-phosphoribosylamino)methylideneamino] imidazole-4-carboxamide isomerase [Rhodospirillaceae bacterium]|nr:1-(5-phosphoribosyl)-5-[(5-phosphoribosylamino)methylideneamino] imidazole-4-carboxamide isomerase [Rhodospirillaceae bacterium]
MDLLPAIDIRGGRCVRLLQGDFGQETRYPVDPVELAQRYADLGAAWLHVVDLDGAAQGAPANLDVVRKMASAANLKIQLGGGIRSRDDLDRALDVVDRAVIGSLAVEAREQVTGWLKELGADRLTLALDVRVDEDDMPRIATHGWTRDSAETLWNALAAYSAAGLRHVLCTDVERDGALQGPNFRLYMTCMHRFPAISFQASGGVRDSRDLSDLAATGVAWAISGKALLEGRITEEEIRSFLPNG